MSTNEQPDTSIPLDRVNSEYHNTTCIRETLLTAEGHQYSGELCLVKGHAGLQQHGRGELRYVHGDIYAGGFELGKRTGFGTCKYASGAQYDGEWNDDVFHGCGQWVGIDGYLYEGSYCNGLPHGTGREVLGAKNEEYIGRFVNGQRDGSGVWTREDGSKYSGTFRDGLPDGKGVLMFPDGSRCFEGSFSKGQMHGKGVMEFANGDRYDGWYENGRALTNGKYQFIPKRDSSSQSPHNSGTVNKLLTATDPTPNVEIDRARECDQATLRANTAELECISFNTRRNAEGVVQEAESDELLIRFPSSTDEQQVLRRPSDDWTQGFGTIVFKKNRERYEGAFVRCTPHGSGCKVYYCPHYSGNVMDSPPAERHSFYKGVWTDGKPGVGFGIMTWCIANESVESNIEKSEEDIDRIQQIPKGNAGYPEADVEELGCIKPYPMTTDYIKWRYEGQWLMGLPNGHGIMYFHPTGTYQGAWTKGVPCGFGCEDLDDERYEGAMDMGVRHGPHGELWIKKNGKHVTGTFVDGWCDDDKGTISCEDYDFYGTIRRNCEEGLGQQKYRNGDVYDGEFREGKKCGCGIMNYQSLGEVVYEGQWKDDKPHGQGIWRFPDGSHYEGGFECGLRHGNGVQYDVEKDLEFTVRYDLGNRIE